MRFLIKRTHVKVHWTKHRALVSLVSISLCMFSWVYYNYRSGRLNPSEQKLSAITENLVLQSVMTFEPKTSLYEISQTMYWTDKPRNQSTVNLSASRWGSILTRYHASSIPSDAVWMPIGGHLAHHMKNLPHDVDFLKIGFVYSAFLDTRVRGSENVLVLGYVHKYFRSGLHCHLRYKNMTNNNGSIETVTVVQAALRMQWPDMIDYPRAYYGYFIICHLPKPDGNVLQEYPVAVSITTTTEETGNLSIVGNNIFVHWNKKLTRTTTQHDNTSENNLDNSNNLHHEMPAPQVAFCVKALRSNYSNPVQLVDFIEFHAMLGVTHFHFYGHTYGKMVSNCRKG